MKMMLAVAASAVAMFSGNGAFAAAGAAVDVTDLTGTISAQLVPIGLAGIAILALTVGTKAYRWIAKVLT